MQTKYHGVWTDKKKRKKTEKTSSRGNLMHRNTLDLTVLVKDEVNLKQLFEKEESEKGEEGIACCVSVCMYESSVCAAVGEGRSRLTF